MNFRDLSPNQLRVSIDLKQTYEAYRDAARAAEQYAGGFSWKTVSGHDYLIKVINRRGGTKSFGPRSEKNEAIFAEFIAGKAKAKAREASLHAYSGEAGQRFHAKLDTHSRASWTVGA